MKDLKLQWDQTQKPVAASVSGNLKWDVDGEVLILFVGCRRRLRSMEINWGSCKEVERGRSSLRLADVCWCKALTHCAGVTPRAIDRFSTNKRNLEPF